MLLTLKKFAIIQHPYTTGISPSLPLPLFPPFLSAMQYYSSLTHQLLIQNRAIVFTPAEWDNAGFGFFFVSVCLMSQTACGSRRRHFFPMALSEILVIKWITWHKASSKLELLLCWWILPELYIDGCCFCRGTINSVVIIIDFPQVIIICHILDIGGFNAASQMAFWLIGTMLQGGTEAILTRSVAPPLCREDTSLSPVRIYKNIQLVLSSRASQTRSQIKFTLDSRQVDNYMFENNSF